MRQQQIEMDIGVPASFLDYTIIKPPGTTSVCFTGTFFEGSRDEMSVLAMSHGADVYKGVSSKIDYLVVGGAHLRKKWNDEVHGGKIGKAKKMIASGHTIRIIDEYRWLDSLEKKELGKRPSEPSSLTQTT